MGPGPTASFHANSMLPGLHGPCLMPAHPPGRVLCVQVPPSIVPLFRSSQSSTSGPWLVHRTYPCLWSSLFLSCSSARPSTCTWTGTSRSDCVLDHSEQHSHQIPLNPRATLFYSPLPAPKRLLTSSCSRTSSSSFPYPSFVSQEARLTGTNGTILFLGGGAATSSPPRPSINHAVELASRSSTTINTGRPSQPIPSLRVGANLRDASSLVGTIHPSHQTQDVANFVLRLLPSKPAPCLLCLMILGLSGAA